MICPECEGMGVIVRGRHDWHPCEPCEGVGILPEPTPGEILASVHDEIRAALSEMDDGD